SFGHAAAGFPDLLPRLLLALRQPEGREAVPEQGGQRPEKQHEYQGQLTTNAKPKAHAASPRKTTPDLPPTITCWRFAASQAQGLQSLGLRRPSAHGVVARSVCWSRGTTTAPWRWVFTVSGTSPKTIVAATTPTTDSSQNMPR